MKKFFLIIFFIFVIFLKGINAELKIALSPFDNCTGYNKYDYLSELVYNFVISSLNNYDGITLLERFRSDLLIIEKKYKIKEIPVVSNSYPSDIIIQGEFNYDANLKKFFLNISEKKSNTSVSNKYCIEFYSADYEELFFKLKNNFIDEFAAKNKLAKRNEKNYKIKIHTNSKITITAFNNYSENINIDPLQKGIVYLLEEKLKSLKHIKLLDRQHIKKICDEQLLNMLSQNHKIPLNIIGADYIIAGCFTVIKNKLKILSRIIDVNSTEIKKSFDIETDANQLSQSVNQLIEETVCSLIEDGCDTANANLLCPSRDESLIYYLRAIEYFDKKEYLKSVEYIDRAITVEPSFIYGKWQAGKIYEDYLKDYSKAISVYKMILTGDASGDIKEKALLRIAMINYNLFKNYQIVCDYLLEFMTKFKESEYEDIVLYTLGHSQQMLGKYDEAIKNYLIMLDSKKFTPIRGIFLIRAGECCLYTKNNKKAVEYFKRARDEHYDEIFKSEMDNKDILIGEEAKKYLKFYEVLNRRKNY